jgi:hypothetical protein
VVQLFADSIAEWRAVGFAGGWSAIGKLAWRPSSCETYTAQRINSLRNGMLNNCVFGTYRAPATNAIIRLWAIGHLQRLSKTVQ